MERQEELGLLIPKVKDTLHDIAYDLNTNHRHEEDLETIEKLEKQTASLKKLIVEYKNLEEK